MNTSIEPLVFLAGVNKLGDAEGWRLAEPSEGGTERAFIQTVQFERAFRSPPVVHVGIVGFDISNHDCARVSLRTSNISTTGFDVTVATWLNSKVWSIDVSWFAIGL